MREQNLLHVIGYFETRSDLKITGELLPWIKRPCDGFTL